MTDWKEYKLGNIVEVVMGQSPDGETCNQKGQGLPLLNGPTEFTLKFPIPVQFTTDPKRICKIGDILFCVRGSTTGRMNIADQEYAIGRGIAAIRHKSGRELLPFLKGLIDNSLPELLNITTGSVFPNITGNDLVNQKVILPPLPEQQAIAEVLSSLDDKIDLLHRQNKTLEALAETLFRQWFVEEAEESWKTKPLEQLCTITRGSSPRPIIEYVKNGTVPWIKIADATGSNTFFIDNTKELIIESGVDKSVKVSHGDLILSNSATCGLPYFVEIEGCIHDGWLLFRDFKEISKLYGFFFLKQINRELNNFADGSVQNNLNTGILKEYPVNVPPENLVKKFDEEAGIFVDKIKRNIYQIRTLTTLRGTLLPKLMSGEVTVEK